MKGDHLDGRDWMLFRYFKANACNSLRYDGVEHGATTDEYTNAKKRVITQDHTGLSS